jgi:trk system potassium uptake protein TrkH
LLKIARANIKKRLSPSRNVTVQSYYRAQGKTAIDNALITDTLSFTLSYMLVFIVGALLITLAEGCSLFEAMFEFASAFGTVGISNGLTNPATGTAALVVEMFGMVLGRLEIFIVFIGIHTGLLRAKKRLTIKMRSRAA